MTQRQGALLHATAHVSRTARRRVLSAFVLGVALSAAGLAALASGVAGARGPFSPSGAQSYAALPISASEADHIALIRYTAHGPRHRDDDADERRSHRLRASVKMVGFGPHDAVCVRLCDGFFFPLPAAAGDAVSQGAACNSLCPDAPTQVFYRGGSDRIEDSYSAEGKPYTALPVSLRYRASSNETCSCHRDAVAYAPLRDATLRRGDAIMTPAGFVVFRGAEGAAHQPGDFSALAASGLPASATAPLRDLERASLATAHPTLRDWMAAQSTPTLASRAALTRVAQAATPSRAISGAGAVASGSKIRLLAWRAGDE